MRPPPRTDLRASRKTRAALGASHKISAMQHERRQRRSAHRTEALSLVLAAHAARANAETVVLADLDGFLVAGAGSAFDHNHLAALAALAHEPLTHGDRLRGATSMPLRVVPIKVDDTALLCASIGHGQLDVCAIEAATSRIVLGS